MIRVCEAPGRNTGFPVLDVPGSDGYALSRALGGSRRIAG